MDYWTYCKNINILLHLSTRAGLPKPRLEGRIKDLAVREWFRDELTKEVCEKPNQFAFLSLGQHLKF